MLVTASNQFCCFVGDGVIVSPTKLGEAVILPLCFVSKAEAGVRCGMAGSRSARPAAPEDG